MEEFLRYLEGHKDLYKPAPTNRRLPGALTDDSNKSRSPGLLYPREQLGTSQGDGLIVVKVEDGEEANVTDEERCVQIKEEEKEGFVQIKEEKEERCVQIKEEAISPEVSTVMEAVIAHAKLEETSVDISSVPRGGECSYANIKAELEEIRPVKIKEEESPIDISTGSAILNDRGDITEAEQQIKTEEETLLEISTDGHYKMSPIDDEMLYDDVKPDPSCVHPECPRPDLSLDPSEGGPSSSDHSLHPEGHKEGETFNCVLCGKRFTIRREFTLHLRSHGRKTYFCFDCNAGFCRKPAFTKHLRKHRVNNSYVCSECGKRFTRVEDSMEHLESHNIKNEPHMCSECGKCFNTREELMQHVESHKVEATYSCSECGKVFTERARLLVHEKSHTKNGSCSCCECGAGFESNIQLAAHMKIHTEKRNFFCLECGMNFSKKSYLLSHQRIHTGKTFSCSNCGVAYTDKYYLLHHQYFSKKCGEFLDFKMLSPQTQSKLSRDSQGSLDEPGAEQEKSAEVSADGHNKMLALDEEMLYDDVRPDPCADLSLDPSEVGPSFSDQSLHHAGHVESETFHCDLCGKRFTIRREFSLHLKGHARSKTYFCFECNTSFPTKIVFMKHLRIHRVNNSYVCSECGKCLTNIEGFMEHLESHNIKNETHLCSECGKCFNTREDLVKHVERHKVERKYWCSQCGKFFTERARLLVHEKSHTKNGSCSCYECGAGFDNNIQLAAHMKFHTEKRTFFCLECGMNFSKKSYLLSHRRIHTGKTFSCLDCGVEYTDKSYLLRHLNSTKKCTEFLDFPKLSPQTLSECSVYSQRSLDEPGAEQENSPEVSTGKK